MLEELESEESDKSIPNKRFDDAISEKLAVRREMRAPIAKDA